MIDRTTKLRWRRKFRRNKQKVEDIGVQAEEHVDKHFFRRLNRLVGVRRFVIGWVSLMVFTMIGVSLQFRSLSQEYQTTVPIEGGIYTEGVLGAFTNANPIYAASAADNSVSELLFSGLLKYDQSNKLVGDLASSYSSDESGAVYTVVLKENILWHDGQPLTSEDVVFTYQTIQNPDAKSPLASSWAGIKVEAIDSRTVKFTLPNVLSAFPYSLTNGIVPKHKLKDIPASQLRSAKFNTVEPVGSGPFKFEAIEVLGDKVENREEKIGLIKNESYFNSPAKLQKMVVYTFRNEKAMLESFDNQQLNAMSGLDTLPDDVESRDAIEEHNIPLTGEVTAFFKNSEGVLVDPKVRQALVRASDTGKIASELAYPVVMANSPLLTTHLGYDKTVTQLSTSLEEAKKLLDNAGWILNTTTSIREKDGKPLSIKLTSRNTSEYAFVTQKLQEQWRAVGVDLQPNLQTSDDFEGTLTRHDYEVLLYGISLGLDPDVFAYWHSSQADIRSASRLNFSEYKSATADKALEAGRTRTDPSIRAIKYKPFLESWRNDAPALVLYQPRYLYVTRGSLYGFEPTTINSATDRFANVNNWMIREEKANN